MLNFKFVRVAGISILFIFNCFYLHARPKILIFSKTEGFRHSSIEVGIIAITALGKQNNFFVDVTEDATLFSANNLQKYEAVVFLNTTGEVLDELQQEVFENYIRSGGGFVGIHAATDTEYDWPWYGRMVGGYFQWSPANTISSCNTHGQNASVNSAPSPAMDQGR